MAMVLYWLKISTPLALWVCLGQPHCEYLREYSLKIWQRTLNSKNNVFYYAPLQFLLPKNQKQFTVLRLFYSSRSSEKANNLNHHMDREMTANVGRKSHEFWH